MQIEMHAVGLMLHSFIIGIVCAGSALSSQITFDLPSCLHFSHPIFHVILQGGLEKVSCWFCANVSIKLKRWEECEQK